MTYFRLCCFNVALLFVFTKHNCQNPDVCLPYHRIYTADVEYPQPSPIATRIGSLSPQEVTSAMQELDSNETLRHGEVVQVAGILLPRKSKPTEKVCKSTAPQVQTSIGGPCFLKEHVRSYVGLYLLEQSYFHLSSLIYVQVSAITSQETRFFFIVVAH